MQFYASCPRGLESLLIDELSSLGASNLKEHPTHIEFEGDLAVGYKACLHSRLANRVFLCLLDQQFHSVEELYNHVNRIEWSWHFDLKDTFAVDCVSRKSTLINHSGFGALKVKDAIVDFFQERYEQRPSVDKDNPDYRIQAIVNGSQLKVGLDLAGRSLNQRGYRDANGRAPIKENLAAALLIRAKWPELARQGYQFHDPMCGTGTLLLEAAMIATDMAPGLLKPDFDFTRWKQHDQELWMEILTSAQRAHSKQKLQVTTKISGSDIHNNSLDLAFDNVQNAGFNEMIALQKSDIKKPKPLMFNGKGLVLTNPPYGERLSEPEKVIQVYRDLGDYIKTNCVGWQAAIITTEASYSKAMGLRSHKQYKLKNGALDCQLYLFDVQEKNFYTPFDPSVVNPKWQQNLSDGALMLKNRLLKNQNRFKSYLKQNGVTCYRLYDADLPEYAAAIDIYQQQVQVIEYSPPKTVPVKISEKRLSEIIRVTSGVLQIPENKIHVIQKKSLKELSFDTQQSEKLARVEVTEQGIKFEVDPSRYLDTGLFFEHRKTRQMLAKKAEGKRLLNLFSYTGSVSVYAALAGAKTTNIDISRAYTNWAIKNFALNQIPIYGHEFIQQDCLYWLSEHKEKKKFDIIFADPPTFSKLKRMVDSFDLQKDQLRLINDAMAMLESDGEMYFCQNSKKFSLEQSILDNYRVSEITAKTLPIDFQKSRNHHRCWLIKHK